MYQLYLVPAGGGEHVRLTFGEAGFGSRMPCWSPDGTRIAFVHELDFNEAEIFTMAPIPGAAGFQVTDLES